MSAHHENEHRLQSENSKLQEKNSELHHALADLQRIMSAKRPDTPTSAFGLSGDGKVKTDWRTIGALMMVTAVVVTGWRDIKSTQQTTNDHLENVVYTDELARFSTGVQLHNPKTIASMPSQDEYLRTSRTQDGRQRQDLVAPEQP
jgi:hypothetical protein